MRSRTPSRRGRKSRQSLQRRRSASRLLSAHVPVALYRVTGHDSRVVRAVLFDLDDTVFDRTAALKRWTTSQVGDSDADTFAWTVELDQRGRRPRLHFAAGNAAASSATVRWMPNRSI